MSRSSNNDDVEVASFPVAEVAPDASKVANDELVGERLGRYQVLRRLGAGGMGVVYEAHDTALDRRVAVKVLPASWTADAHRRARFVREARAGAALNHRGIATVHDVGEHHGRVYIAMEYVEGTTLAQRLGSGALPTDEVVHIAHAIAAALHMAHASGVVHRDLKPANVMVSSDGSVKLLDFGLAKRVDEHPANAPSEEGLTDADRVMGTAGYMSPEQTRGAAVDAATDVFAWGAIVYEMLTGTMAFAGDSSAERIAATLKDEPANMERAAARLPPPTGELLRRALSKDPDARPPSDELACALSELQTPLRLGVRADRTDRPFATPPSQDIPPPPPATGDSTAAHPKRSRARWLGAGALAIAAAVLAWLASQGLRSGTTLLVVSSPPPAPSASSPQSPKVHIERLAVGVDARHIRAGSRSPDGRRVAAVVQGELALIERASGRWQAIQLPERHAPLEVDWWSGDELVVLADQAGTSMLLRVPLAGEPSTLFDDVANFAMAPDRTRMAVLQQQLWIVELKNMSRRQIRRPSGGRYARIAWSPDGRNLALGKLPGDGDTEAEVWLVPTDGRDPWLIMRDRRLQLSSGFVLSAWLAPRTLLLARNEESPEPLGANLWAFDLDEASRANNPPRRVTNWVGMDLGDLRSAGAGAVTLVRRVVDFEVLTGELHAGGKRLSAVAGLTRDKRNDRSTAWAPDCSAVWFMSDRSGPWLAYAQPPGGQPASLVPATTEGDWITWAQPWRDEILFWQLPGDPSVPNRTARLMSFRPGSKERRQILTRPLPSFLHRGRPAPMNDQLVCLHGECVLGSAEGSLLRLERLDPDSGKRARLTELEVDQAPFLLAPSGDDVAVTTAESHFTLVRVEDGHVRRLRADGGCTVQFMAKLPRDDGWIATCNFPARLVHLDTTGRETLLRSASAGADWMAQPVLCSDGGRIAFTERNVDTELWRVSFDAGHDDERR